MAGQASHTAEHTLWWDASRTYCSDNKRVLQRTGWAGQKQPEPLLQQAVETLWQQDKVQQAPVKRDITYGLSGDRSVQGKGSLSVHLGNVGELHPLLLLESPVVPGAEVSVPGPSTLNKEQQGHNSHCSLPVKSLQSPFPPACHRNGLPHSSRFGQLSNDCYLGHI